jgi:uncharacterized membrane protein
MKISQDRLKSPVLWAGVVSVIVLLMGNYGLWDFIGMTEPVFKNLADLLLVVLGLLGVINDPTNKSGL